MITYHTGRNFATGKGKKSQELGRLNEIEAALGHAGAIAFGASAANDERVAAGIELVLAAHFAHRRFDGGTLKLDHLAALFAVHVLVLRIAVVMFVVHARP